MPTTPAHNDPHTGRLRTARTNYLSGLNHCKIQENGTATRPRGQRIREGRLEVPVVERKGSYMSFFDKAKSAAKSALNNDKVEQVTDKVLDKAEQVANDKLGPDKAEKVRNVRDKIDEQVGDEKRSDGPTTKGPDPDSPIQGDFDQK